MSCGLSSGDGLPVSNSARRPDLQECGKPLPRLAEWIAAHQCGLLSVERLVCDRS